jgi:hypothetical protein
MQANAEFDDIVNLHNEIKDFKTRVSQEVLRNFFLPTDLLARFCHIEGN